MILSADAGMGVDPTRLAAAVVARFSVGCPSDRVQSGRCQSQSWWLIVWLRCKMRHPSPSQSNAVLGLMIWMMRLVCLTLLKLLPRVILPLHSCPQSLVAGAK